MDWRADKLFGQPRRSGKRRSESVDCFRHSFGAIFGLLTIGKGQVVHHCFADANAPCVFDEVAKRHMMLLAAQIMVKAIVIVRVTFKAKSIRRFWIDHSLVRRPRVRPRFDEAEPNGWWQLFGNGTWGANLIYDFYLVNFFFCEESAEMECDRGGDVGGEGNVSDLLNHRSLHRFLPSMERDGDVI